MSEDDKKKVLKRYSDSVSRTRNENEKISNEIFMLSKFGYYYGWAAVMAVRNNEITLEEMFALLEGAEKVHFIKLVENARTDFIATASAMASKDGAVHFEKGMKPYIERAKIEEE